ncbi:MAG: hypothetical protein H0U76_05740 [Ktedonobacteraceae bacterium]|nr:hypothetical protein [Ktedonobacteraceae bacterium]
MSTGAARAAVSFGYNCDVLPYIIVVILIAFLLGSVTRVFRCIRASKSLVRISETFLKDYFVGETGGVPMTYVALGASTAVGTGVQRVEQTYPYLIASHFALRGYSVHVINLAQNGTTLEQIVRDQMPQVAQFHPHLITVSAGTNDVFRGTPIDKYRIQASQLADGLLHTHATNILISNTPNLSNAPAIPMLLRSVGRWKARLQNTALTAALAQRSIQIIDVYHNLPYLRDYYAADGLHPSVVGYDQWSRLFIAQLSVKIR